MVKFEQNNTTFYKIELIIVCLFCSLSFFYFLILSFDLFQFVSNPSDYAIVYQKFPKDQEWVKGYIIQSLVNIGICVLIVGLSIWRLIKPNKILRIILDLIYLLLIITFIIGFYKWYLTGFDH